MAMISQNSIEKALAELQEAGFKLNEFKKVKGDNSITLESYEELLEFTIDSISSFKDAIDALVSIVDVEQILNQLSQKLDEYIVEVKESYSKSDVEYSYGHEVLLKAGFTRGANEANNLLGELMSKRESIIEKTD